jgi:hypothetical protein
MKENLLNFLIIGIMSNVLIGAAWLHDGLYDQIINKHKLNKKSMLQVSKFTYNKFIVSNDKDQSITTPIISEDMRDPKGSLEFNVDLKTSKFTMRVSIDELIAFNELLSELIKQKI